MNIGIIGLGRMGSAVAYRLLKKGFSVFGYDPHVVRQNLPENLIITDSIKELAIQTQTAWLLVPAGTIVTETVYELAEYMKPASTVVDGGNSHFNDAQKHAKILKAKNIAFLDCGTSGGVHGKENGFCLMIGGDKAVYDLLAPQLNAIAAPSGHTHVGPTGAGHLVKMVHNGIEYGIMQAYAEGLHLLHAQTVENHKLDLAQITALWQHGSVIRSWLLELTHAALIKYGTSLKQISGVVESNGMGEWTVQEAEKSSVPVPVIKTALTLRYDSVKTGGNYASKLVALMRNQFGGHRFFVKDEHGNH